MDEVFVPGAGRAILLGGGNGQKQAPVAVPNAPLLATGFELRPVDVQGVPGIMFLFNRAGQPYPPMILALPPEQLEHLPDMIWKLLDGLLPNYRDQTEEKPD